MKRVETFLILLVLSGIAAVFLPSVSHGLEGGNAGFADVRKAGSRVDVEVLDTTGKKVSFRSFIGGKPLVVVFWATWCPLCRDEVPTLNRLAADPAIRVLGVNVGENEQKVRTFITSNHVGYPVVRDPGWQTTAAYQVLGLPAFLILDEEGQVLYRGSIVPGNIEDYLR